MQEENLIPANEFCLHHKIEISFIQSLQEFGLVETVIREESIFIPAEQLAEVEKMMRWHYDLHVNFEGIDVIRQLLNRLENMEREMSVLRNQLRFYDNTTLP